ncbi:Transposase [Phytophthora megakarya]|uniref:Transposase n=1 Tax=Phytophthora megakarya TaxID=4795 RepID=A0A225W0S8_9STRA|nr:Transposase [Phytophthora megakarya]
MHLFRGEGWSCVGERATVALPPSQGANLHVQGGVSPEAGIELMRTHGTDENHELNSSNKGVVVTDNAPAHSQVEALVRHMLVADDIVNGPKLVLRIKDARTS